MQVIFYLTRQNGQDAAGTPLNSGRRLRPPFKQLSSCIRLQQSLSSCGYISCAVPARLSRYRGLSLDIRHSSCNNNPDGPFLGPAMLGLKPGGVDIGQGKWQHHKIAGHL